MAKQAQDAAQGRRIAKGLGDDVEHATLSEANWADYGRRAASAMARGDSVPHAVEARATQPAPAPTRPAPAPRSSSSSGSGILRSAARPVTSQGAATKLVIALVAGLVVLEVGSQLTGQYFNLGLGKGSNPTPPAPPTYKPLVAPTAAATNASKAVGAVASGVTAAGAANGTHETAPVPSSPRGSAP